MKHVNIVEVLCMAALLLLFGVTSIFVVAQGSNTYEKILERRTVASDLRVANSYISMRVRQLDEGGAMELRSIYEENDCLILYLTADDGSLLEHAIYYADGALQEQVYFKDWGFDPTLGDTIITLDGFHLSLENGLLIIQTQRMDDTHELRLSMRSEALA
jgi:hypothetical protein